MKYLGLLSLKRNEWFLGSVYKDSTKNSLCVALRPNPFLFSNKNMFLCQMRQFITWTKLHYNFHYLKIFEARLAALLRDPKLQSPSLPCSMQRPD